VLDPAQVDVVDVAMCASPEDSATKRPFPEKPPPLVSVGAQLSIGRNEVISPPSAPKAARQSPDLRSPFIFLKDEKQHKSGFSVGYYTFMFLNTVFACYPRCPCIG